MEERTCRFCGKYANEARMVKYGVRHYAHHACFLDAGHNLTELYPWQVGQFPARLLLEHGLVDEAEQISGADKHTPLRPHDRSKPF